MLIFWSEFRISGVVAPRRGPMKLLRYKFVLRFGGANRKRWSKKLPENTAKPNEFTDFEKFKVEHPPRIKTILATTSVEQPVSGITLRLTALRVT